MDHCAHFFCDFFYLDIVIFLLRIPASFIFCHPTGWLVFSWMCTDTSLFLSPKECIFLSSFKHHSVVPSGDVSSHPVSFIWTRLAFSILPPSYPKTSTRIYIPLIELFPNMVWFPNMVSKLAYPAWFQRYSESCELITFQVPNSIYSRRYLCVELIGKRILALEKVSFC